MTEHSTHERWQISFLDERGEPVADQVYDDSPPSFDALEAYSKSAQTAGGSVFVCPPETSLRQRTPSVDSRQIVCLPQTGAAPRTAMSEPIELLVIEGHGDGMHIRIGDAALCGSLVRSGSAGTNRDCSFSEARCAKQRVVDDVIFAGELDVRVAVLFSCNSINVAGQLGPTTNSLARALLRTGAESVLGLTRQAENRHEDLALVREHWQEGRNIAHIANALNQGRDVGRNGAVVVLGDWQSATSSPPRLHDPNRATKTSAEPTNSGASRTAVEPRRTNQASPASLISTVRNDLLHAERFERTLAIRASRDMTDEIAAALGSLRSSRELIERCYWSLVTLASADRPPPQRVLEALSAGTDAWAVEWINLSRTGMMGLTRGRTTGDDLSDLLVAGMQESMPLLNGGCCANCGGVIRERRYRVVGGGADQSAWLRRECTGCGILDSTDERNAPRVTVEPGPRFQAGSAAGVKISPDTRSEQVSEGRRTRVYIQFRDKSQISPVYEDCHEFDREGEVRIPIPPHAGPDQCSLRVLICRGLRFSYVRRVGRIIRCP